MEKSDENLDDLEVLVPRFRIPPYIYIRVCVYTINYIITAGIHAHGQIK